jgi:predicted Zn-dependent protease
MKKSLHSYSFLWFFLAAFLFSGCAVNPVTGQQQLMLVSEQEEFQLGRSTDQSVIEQYGVYDDSGLQNYLQTMGLGIAHISHRPNLDWQFKVMDSPVVNAFAAPGGYVYVTRGLLAAINNEAELAGVLGHEIGHVTARHSAQQYSNMMLANLGLSVSQGLLGDYGDLLGPMVETGARLLFLKFSRDDERESDALGVEYATRAGYDARYMADFFVSLERQPAEGDQQAARLPEFLSTHPNPANREATVRALAAQWQARTPGQVFRVNRAQLLSQLDGLVYGDDPRKGFREGDWYYLPRYQRKLPIPKGWKLAREGNNLQMSHPQGKAVSILGIRPASSTNEIVAAFLQATGAEVVQQQRSSTGGLPTLTLLSVITNGQQRSVVVSHFIQAGSDVFAFHAMTSASNYTAMNQLMQQPATGFTVMTDPGRINRQPQRIVLATVAKTASLEKTLLAMHIEQSLWTKIAWLNGLQPGELVNAGERIKLIR